MPDYLGTAFYCVTSLLGRVINIYYLIINYLFS